MGMTVYTPLEYVLDDNQLLSTLESTRQRGAEINLLIATDCISEKQNLQDCNFLINHDIHWNPVRIIQRFGRIY